MRVSRQTDSARAWPGPLGAHRDPLGMLRAGLASAAAVARAAYPPLPPGDAPPGPPRPPAAAAMTEPPGRTRRILSRDPRRYTATAAPGFGPSV